jgi:hypothetical protein
LSPISVMIVPTFRAKDSVIGCRAIPSAETKLPPLLPAAARFVGDSPLEGGVRCELVSKVSFIRRSDEFLESIKKGDRNVKPV